MSDELLAPYIKSIFEMVKNYPEAFSHLDNELKSNKALILRLINTDGRFFGQLSDELKNDKDIILAALSTNPHILSEISPNMLEDSDIMLTALSMKGRNLQYATDAQKKNRKYVELAIAQDGTAIEYADSTLQEDRELAVKAVQTSGQALYYLLDQYKNDRAIVLIAVNGRYGFILNRVPDCFKSDLEIVISALYQSFNNQPYIPSDMLSHPVIQFVMAHKAKFIPENYWPIIKEALLKQPDKFLNPPALISDLAGNGPDKYFLLAHYALHENSYVPEDINEIENFIS